MFDKILKFEVKNRILFGIFVIYSFFKRSAIPHLLLYLSMVLALIGAVTVFTGILEFGMRYMPTILFYTICIYSGVGLIIYQARVATMQRMQKRISYVLAGLIFTVVFYTNKCILGILSYY